MTLSNSPESLSGMGFSGDIKGVWLFVESGSVRYRYDGGTPSAISGHLLTAGKEALLVGSANLENFQMIRATGTDAVVSLAVSHEGEIPAQPTADFYVDYTGGSDSGAGTFDDPWKTTTKIESTTLAAGARIVFKRGEVWPEVWTISTDNNHGTAEEPIYYGAYGYGARPQFTGCDSVTGWTVDAGSRYQATVVNSIDVFLVLEDNVMATRVASAAAVNGVRKFFFDDGTNTLYYWASDGADPDTHSMKVAATRYEVLSADNCSHIIFEDLYLHGAGGEWSRGFGAYPPTATVTDITLRNVRISNCYYCGVWLSNAAGEAPVTDITFDNCEVDHCGTFGIRYDPQDADHMQTGMSLLNSHVHHNGLDLTLGQFGILAAWVDGLIVTNCFIHDNQGQFDWSGNLYLGSAPNARVFFNTFAGGNRNNLHFDGASNGFIAKYNLSYGATWNGIAVEEHVGSNGASVIYGNTLYGNLHGMAFGPGGSVFEVSGVTVRNNLIAFNHRANIELNEDNVDPSYLDNDLDYNLYFIDEDDPLFEGEFRSQSPRVNQTFAEWKTYTGWDAHSQVGDPLFVDVGNVNFRLQAASPAIDTGKPLGDAYREAFNGEQDALWDIGAYVAE